MEQVLIDLVQRYPEAMSFFVIIGVFRTLFKPIVALLDAYVKETPNDNDNKALEDFKAGKIYKSLVWIVDYLLSIKLPKK